MKKLIFIICIIISTIADGTDLSYSGGNVNIKLLNGNTISSGSGTTDSGTTRVVLPTDQSSIPVTVSGVATSANQSTEITSLSTIATNSGTQATSNNQTNGNQLTKITNGTQSADTVAGDSGQNGLIVTNSKKVITWSGVTTTQVIDVTNYSSVTINVSAVSGTWTVKQSGDNVNFNTILGDTGGSFVQSSQNIGTANVTYNYPINNKYIQISGGTSITATVILSSTVNPQRASGVFQASNWTVNQMQSGQSANGSSVSGFPVRIGAKALTSNSNVATGQAADLISTLTGAIIQKPYSIPEADWSYVAASGGISNTTTAVTIAAAAGSGLRNYVTSCDVTSTALGAGTELAIRDGASGTVIWRIDLTTSGLSGFNKIFNNPIKSSANTLLEVVTLTATVTGNVYINCQGYIAP